MDESIGTLLHGDAVDESEVKRMRDLVLFEGSAAKKKLIKFFSLLILAASIATYGLLGDSVAVVIGAMIIAPLMLPIVGVAFGLSIGDSLAIKHTLLVSLGGIITTIAVGFILALPLINIFQVENISQIMIRTSPGLIDLLASLFTGVAGAFALSRRDVSDTLPGIAIAISLVPPLANVGILLAFSNYTMAMGSLLLFMTNYFAILLTGASLFGFMGFTKAAILKQPTIRWKGVAISMFMLILISLPLGYNGYNIYINNSINQNVNLAVNDWLEGSEYELLSVDAETIDNIVIVRIVGEGEIPPLEELEQRIRGELFGRQLKLEVIPSKNYFLNDT